MMPIRLQHLRRSRVDLNDGAEASVETFWYDNEDWVMRFASINTGSSTRIVPTPLLDVDEHYALQLPLALPDLYPLESEHFTHGNMDDAGPDRHHERAILAWYGLPVYWGGSGPWRDSRDPKVLLADTAARDARSDQPRTNSTRLVTTASRDERLLFDIRDVLCETLACPDGAYGWVDDLVVDVDSWALRQLIVRALPAYHNRTPDGSEASGDALISPFWGTWDTDADQLRVPFTRATIWASPFFKPDALAPKDEHVLARYYGFVRDW